jgi:MoxR-like ATPase
LAGRHFATPDDIRELATSVLAHRLVMTPEAEGDANARAAVIAEAVSRIGYRRAVRPV